MTAEASSGSTTNNGLSSLWATIQPPLQSFALLLLRIALAVPFFRSGVNKWEGFLALKPSTTFLFASEFKLHILGGEYPMPYPELMAYLSALGEVALPILLVLGLATRFAGLGVLAMAMVIQLTYPSHWPNEALPWSAMAIVIIAFGPGRLAIDRVIRGAIGRRST